MSRGTSRPSLAAAVLCALALFAVACGYDDAEPTPAGAPVLTIHNETNCNVHIRFDNGAPAGSVAARSTLEYSHDRLDEYRYMQVESTKAIFRNLELSPIRDNGWSVTISDAFGDGECVDVPDARS